MRCLLTLLCLALLATAAQRARAQDLDPGAEPGVVDQALYSKEWRVRLGAAQRAGEQRAAEAVDRLIELLGDEVRGVRLAAVEALVRLGAKEAIRQLTVLAQTDREPAVRAAATRAVLALDPRRYASTLATADPPPVQPAPQVEEDGADEGEAGGRGRAVLFSAALALDGLRPGETVSGQAAFGLRWPHLDLQLTLNAPALALVWQARANLLASFWLVPYVTLGAAISYNNDQVGINGPSAALLAGGGLRAGPFGRPDPARFLTRLYGYAEVLLSWTASQPTPPGQVDEPETLALPIIVGLGLELWP